MIVADLPGAPGTPALDAATATSIAIGWSAPASNGGSAITGYRLYMNDL